MKKVGLVIFVCILSALLGLMFWQFQNQRDLDFESRNFISSETSEVLRIDNNQWQTLFNDSSVQWSNSWQSKLNLINQIQNKYGFLSLEFTDVVAFFKGENLQAFYFEFISNLEESELTELGFKYLNDNNLWGDGTYFARIHQNKLVLSKDKALILSKEKSKTKFRNNPTSSLQLLNLKSQFEEDIYIENNEVHISKSSLKAKHSDRNYTYPLLDKIPKYFNEFRYAKRTTQFSDSAKNRFPNLYWLANDYCEIELDNAKLILANYEGRFHPEEIINEIKEESGDTIFEQISLRNQTYFKVDLNDNYEFKDDVKWVGSIEDVIVFASSKSALENFEIALQTGNIFNKTDFDKIPRNSTFVEYGNLIGKSKISLSMDGQPMAYAESNGYSFSHFKYELEASNQIAPKQKEWEIQLSSKVLTGTLIPDHIDGGEGLAMLNAKNQLIYINQNGKKKWIYEVKEPILGSVQFIDILGNKKKQIVVSTKNNLHIIDLKGNSLGGFPAKYSAPATTMVACLDYDKNNNYRFLTGHQNGTISNIDEKGKLVQGWQFQAKTSAIQGEIKHYLVANKDYIQYHDANNLQYFVARNGTDRTLKIFNVSSPQIDLIKNSYEKSSSVTLDKNYLKIQFWNGARDSLTVPLTNYKFIKKIDRGSKKYFVLEQNNRLHFLNCLGVIEFEIPLIKPELYEVKINFDTKSEIDWIAYSDDKFLYLTNESGVLEKQYPKNVNKLFWLTLQNKTLTRVLTYFDGKIKSSPLK